MSDMNDRDETGKANSYEGTLVEPPAVGAGNTNVVLGDWRVQESLDSTYLHVTHAHHPGQIDIKAETDGYVVDVWPDGEDEDDVGTEMQVAATLAVEYVELAKPDSVALLKDDAADAVKD